MMEYELSTALFIKYSVVIYTFTTKCSKICLWNELYYWNQILKHILIKGFENNIFFKSK